MAERTVNVTINYKVNTADVVKAQAASRAAQKATDDLRKSSDQYGKAAAQAHKQAGDAARKAQSDTASLSREFNSLYNSVRLFLTAGLAKELLDASLNMAKLSGQVDGVARAFNRIPNATLLLNDLRRATHGTVTDLELMQKTLMAQNFKIPLEKLGTLLEFAAVKAQQTGQDVNHLVNYIVSGIGYNSIKRLDDLGFTLNRVREATGGISLTAATMEQKMDAIAKLIAEDFQKTGGFIETAKTEVEELEVSWHELRVTISEALTNPALIRFYNNVVKNMTAGVVFLTQGQKGLNELVAKEQAIKEVTNFQEVHLGKEVLKDRQKAFDLVQQEANTRQQMIGRNNDELKKLAERQKEIRDGGVPAQDAVKELDAVNEQIEFYNFKNLVLKESIRILVEYNETLEETNAKEEKSLGLVAKKRAEIEALQDQIEETTRSGDLGQRGALIMALQKAQGELDALLGKSKEKQKESANEIQEYLAYLSDLEMFNMRALLDERIAGRKKTAEEEIRIEKEKQQKLKEQEEEEARRKEQLQQTILSLSEELLRSTLELGLTNRNDDLENIRAYYDKQIELAGDNDRAKNELRAKQERELEQARQRQKEAEKKAATARILIDGLIAISKIFGEFGWPAGIAPAAIMAGITAVNVAQVRKYKKGGINIPGPGNETSDSIPAMLSRGESVMTAKATRRSMGLLEAIQANKIDDRLLKTIDFSGGRTIQANMDDGRIVNELRAIRNSQYQLEQQGRQLYKVYRDLDGNRKRVRYKNIGV